MQRILITIGALVAALSYPPEVKAADPGCAVVSFADAGKALGTPVATVTSRSLPGHTSCSYKAATGFKRLTVTIMPFKSTAESAATFHAMVSDSRTQLTPSANLTGIGDEAHRSGPSVYVRKNDTIYVFTQIAPDPSGAAALRTVDLARASISRVR